MSVQPTSGDYSIGDGDEDLRTAFDEEFDWEDDAWQEHGAYSDTLDCRTISLRLCP